VEVTRDMAHAKVFVTALQSERAKETMKAAEGTGPGIRYQLARAVKMRHVPELHFHYDDSVDRGERIDNLLRDVVTEPARIRTPTRLSDAESGPRLFRASGALGRTRLPIKHPVFRGWTASCCSTSRRGCPPTRPCSACAICSAPRRAAIPAASIRWPPACCRSVSARPPRSPAMLLGARKAYETVARLGIVTDTDDAEGQPLRERPVPALTIDAIDAALRDLTGRIRQRPPIYSALKRGGEPLYAKARRGEAIEIEAREVDVHAFDLLNAADLLDGGDAPQLRLHVECGSGTYVRSLVRDLGELLGCGAHVAELRRLWVDPFRDRGCGRTGIAGGPRWSTRSGERRLRPACCRSRPAWCGPAPDRSRLDAGRRSGSARARSCPGS
jgi:tRNA pseudouridine(55) synthase